MNKICNDLNALLISLALLLIGSSAFEVHAVDATIIVMDARMTCPGEHRTEYTCRNQRSEYMGHLLDRARDEIANKDKPVYLFMFGMTENISEYSFNKVSGKFPAYLNTWIEGVKKCLEKESMDKSTGLICKKGEFFHLKSLKEVANEEGSALGDSGFYFRQLPADTKYSELTAKYRTVIGNKEGIHTDTLVEFSTKSLKAGSVCVKKGELCQCDSKNIRLFKPFIKILSQIFQQLEKNLLEGETATDGRRQLGSVDVIYIGNASYEHLWMTEREINSPIKKKREEAQEKQQQRCTDFESYAIRDRYDITDEQTLIHPVAPQLIAQKVATNDSQARSEISILKWPMGRKLQYSDIHSQIVQAAKTQRSDFNLLWYFRINNVSSVYEPGVLQVQYTPKDELNLLCDRFEGQTDVLCGFTKENLKELEDKKVKNGKYNATYRTRPKLYQNDVLNQQTPFEDKQLQVELHINAVTIKTKFNENRSVVPLPPFVRGDDERKIFAKSKALDSGKATQLNCTYTDNASAVCEWWDLPADKYDLVDSWSDTTVAILEQNVVRWHSYSFWNDLRKGDVGDYSAPVFKGKTPVVCQDGKSLSIFGWFSLLEDGQYELWQEQCNSTEQIATLDVKIDEEERWTRRLWRSVFTVLSIFVLVAISLYVRNRVLLQRELNILSQKPTVNFEQV